MSKMFIGRSVMDLYDHLKRSGYIITAFLDRWFRAECADHAIECEFDKSHCVTRLTIA